MPSFVFVTFVPSGALPSVFVASKSFSPYGVRVGVFLGGIFERGNCLSNMSAKVSIILPFDSKSPMPGGLLFQTPDTSRGLYGMPTELNFASAFCCSGVRQCGHVFQPGGGCSAWANAAEDEATAAVTANIKTRTLFFIWLSSPSAAIARICFVKPPFRREPGAQRSATIC